MKIITNPPKKIINELLNLYSRGQLDSVVKRTIELIEHFEKLKNLDQLIKKENIIELKEKKKFKKKTFRKKKFYKKAK